MSFVSEPVCMPHCPAGETWFSRGVKAFWEFHFQAEHGSQRAAAWRHEALSATPDDETTRLFFRLYQSLYLSPAFWMSLCLSFILARYFLTGLISRKTHEYMRPLRNLMDLEWTWELATQRHLKYFNINLVWFEWISFDRYFIFYFLSCFALIPWITLQVFMCWNNGLFE